MQHDLLTWQGEEALLTELRQLAERRALRTLAVVQDLCDTLLALNDINGASCETPSLPLNDINSASRLAPYLALDGINGACCLTPYVVLCPWT